MIYSKSLNDNFSLKFEKIKDFLSEKIGFKNILFVLISLLLANQGFLNNTSPFSFVLLGVASVFNVPLILVLLSSVLSLLIGKVAFATIAKVLVFFLFFSVITVALNIEGMTRKNSVFIKFLASYILVDSIFNFANGTFFTNLFANMSNALIELILYFILVSGVYVIINITQYSRLRKGGKEAVMGETETKDTHVHVLEDGTVITHSHGEHGHHHSHAQTKAVLNRLSRAIGHLESIRRMVEAGRDCSEVLIQLSAVKSAINNTGKIILQDHIEHCIVDAVEHGDKDAIKELERAIDRFMK